MIVRGILIGFLVVACSSCTSMNSLTTRVGSWFESKDNAPEVSRSNASQGEQSSVPFEVVVYDEVNDGEQLFIRAGIKSKRDWPIQDLVLLLTGTRDGEPVEQEVILLGATEEVILAGLSDDGKSVRSQEELLVSLKIPSGSITDYQLDLLWGNEAAPYLRRAPEAGQMARAGLATPKVSQSRVGGADSSREPLHIEDFRIVTHTPNCGRSNCPSMVKLEGKLVNMGPTTLNDATLALVFKWIPHSSASLDLSGSMPQNEELIQLRGLKIEPGGSKPFRFVLDRPIPEAKGGKYVPELKVATPSSR